MKVAFVRPDLRHVDGATGEAMALGVFSDERPLMGMTGLVDWRLNGRLSQWIAAGRFSGEDGEALLFPDPGRLPFDRIVLYGLGTSAAYGPQKFRQAAPRFLRVLRDMGVSRFAAPIPGWRFLQVNPRVAVEQWLHAIREVYLDEGPEPEAPDVLIVEDAEIQRATWENVQSFLRRMQHGV